MKKVLVIDTDNATEVMDFVDQLRDMDLAQAKTFIDNSSEPGKLLAEVEGWTRKDSIEKAAGTLYRGSDSSLTIIYGDANQKIKDSRFYRSITALILACADAGSSEEKK